MILIPGNLYIVDESGAGSKRKGMFIEHGKEDNFFVSRFLDLNGVKFRVCYMENSYFIQNMEKYITPLSQ